MIPQSDPFSSFRIGKNQSQESGPKIKEPESNTQDPFSEVRIKQSKEVSPMYEIGRHATRVGSRIAETLGGIPGDISSLIQSGVFSGLEKLTGIPASKEAKEEAKKQRLPTSEELKGFSEDISKGFTSPKNPTEKSIDEFVQTASGLLGPMKFRKALGVGLGSQLAKEGIKTLGLSEGSQEAGKLGTLFLLSAMNPGGAMKYATSQYDKASSLSRGASISATEFEKNLKSMVSDLKKGVTTTSKNQVLKPAEELLEKVKNGKIPVQELTSAKRDINTLMGDPSLLKREKILLKKLGKEVDYAIKPYERLNPNFSKAYRPANEIYGAVMQGNKAANFLKKTLGTKSVIGAALAEAALGHPEYILPTAATAAGSLGVAKSIDFFTRLKNSPELRKYYQRALLAASKEDAALVRTYADKIEQILNED